MNSFHRSFAALLVVLGTSQNDVQSWSPSPKNGNSPKADFERQEDSPSSRRQLFQQSAAALAAVGMASVPQASHAACLQGDVRPTCIGIYKVPMDDAILPYVGTPEDLQKYAPGLNYIPPIEAPKSFHSAMAILRAQQKRAEDIRTAVMKGNLEKAGVEVLGLIPQVTSSSKRVFAELETKIREEGLVANRPKSEDPTESEETVETMAIEMAQDQMYNVNGYWGDCDIAIGQGIRGELGGLTVAQLAILESLRDAKGALDDFLVTADTLSGESFSKRLAA